MNDRRLALKKLSALIALSLFSGSSVAHILPGDDNLTVYNDFPNFSDDDIIEKFKLSLCFGLGFIPYFGNILSFLVRFLWPSPEKDIWSEIKEKVEVLINKKLDEDAYERLKKVLDGLNSVLKQYLNTIKAGASDEEIKTHFFSVNLMFIDQRPWFQQKNHQYILYPLFSIFSSLHLTFLRDALVNNKEIFSENEYLLLKTNMKEYIKEYSDYIVKIVENERQNLENKAPTQGKHNTDYYNYFSSFNAISIKYCDDYVEMFNQMDIDENPTSFELDRTKFKDIYSKAYGTADDWDRVCGLFSKDSKGVTSIYRKPESSFSSIYLDYFDGRPTNLNIYYPEGKGPFNNEGSRVNDTYIIAEPHSGVEKRNVVIDSVDDENFPISYAIIKCGSIPSMLTLFDINGKDYNLWNSYEAHFQNEEKIEFVPRRLSTITAWSRSRYYDGSLGCLIFGFSWVPPKNKDKDLLVEHYISAIDEPYTDTLSEIHGLDASQFIKAEHEYLRDEYWSDVNDFSTNKGSGAIELLPLIGIGGAAFLKK